MKLTDLNPNFVGHGGPGSTHLDGTPIPQRSGIGIIFDCPCGCENLCYVGFRNPIDGGSVPFDDGHPKWQREGETFEDLTLTPSIHRSRGCGWHGFITKGEVSTCGK